MLRADRHSEVDSRLSLERGSCYQTLVHSDTRFLSNSQIEIKAIPTGAGWLGRAYRVYCTLVTYTALTTNVRASTWGRETVTHKSHKPTSHISSKPKSTKRGSTRTFAYNLATEIKKEKERTTDRNTAHSSQIESKNIHEPNYVCLSSPSVMHRRREEREVRNR